MEQIFKIFGILVAVGAGAAVVYAMIAAVNVVAERLKGRETPSDEVLAELETLRAEVAELQATRARVAELEERVDFAERLLTQRTDVSRLPE